MTIGMREGWERLIALHMRCEAEVMAAEDVTALFLKRIAEDAELSAFWRGQVQRGAYEAIANPDELTASEKVIEELEASIRKRRS